MNTASQHKEEIIKNSSFPALCYKLSVQIRSVILDKIYAYQGRKEWFWRYTLVLLQEIDSFNPIINKISKNERLQNQYAKELVFYYGLVIGLYRFLEGVSWGYSTLLSHKELDNDNMTSIKVLYNFMVRLKRFFLVKKEDDFSDCKPSTLTNVNDYVNNEIDFIGSIDHDDMENLVKGNVEPSKKYSDQYEYLNQLDDPKILAEEKDVIVDFASRVIMEEISVKSIDKLHKKKRKSNKVEPVTIMTEESKEEGQDKSQEHEFPLLETSNNILGIKCSERVSKLLFNHLSKFSNPEKSQEKNLISITHYCCAQNKLTYDSYYIVKNIIYSILNKCPEILSFFKLLDLDINVDIFFNLSESLKRDHTEIFTHFLKKLRELKLDYNIVVCVSQWNYAYNKNNLHNFVYLLRHAIKYAPPYLKFVLTFTNDSILQMDEITRVLLIGSENEVHVNGKEQTG